MLTKLHDYGSPVILICAMLLVPANHFFGMAMTTIYDMFLPYVSQLQCEAPSPNVCLLSISIKSEMGMNFA